jgi:RimJ/RimL family protein N-acetyltransferase
MYHRFTEEGYGLRLRPVCLDDAAFVLSLRKDPELGRWLGRVSGTEADQRAWIERYFDKPNDYYFLVETLDAVSLGTIGVYDVTYREGVLQAEWGRWILRPSCFGASGSSYLCMRFAFETLRVDRLICHTLEPNTSVLSFHDRIGAVRSGSVPNFLGERGTGESAIRHEISIAQWPIVKARLESAATAARRLLPKRPTTMSFAESRV